MAEDSFIASRSTKGTCFSPLALHGHRKADARRIRDLTESYQSTLRS